MQLHRAELGGEAECHGRTGLIGDEVVLPGVSVRVLVSVRRCPIPRGPSLGARMEHGKLRPGSTWLGLAGVWESIAHLRLPIPFAPVMGQRWSRCQRTTSSPSVVLQRRESVLASSRHREAIRLQSGHLRVLVILRYHAHLRLSTQFPNEYDFDIGPVVTTVLTRGRGGEGKRRSMSVVSALASSRAISHS